MMRPRSCKTLQMERTYFGRLMIFDLPDASLELADRSEMPERVLREIIRYDAKFWPRLSNISLNLITAVILTSGFLEWNRENAASPSSYSS